MKCLTLPFLFLGLAAHAQHYDTTQISITLTIKGTGQTITEDGYVITRHGRNPMGRENAVSILRKGKIPVALPYEIWSWGVTSSKEDQEARIWGSKSRFKYDTVSRVLLLKSCASCSIQKLTGYEVRKHDIGKGDRISTGYSTPYYLDSNKMIVRFDSLEVYFLWELTGKDKGSSKQISEKRKGY